MNVFELKERLIADYSSFVKGFITIKDEAIKRIVSEELNAGMLWPDPLLQLSPFFTIGDSIDQLVSAGMLAADCARIFRIKKDPNDLGKLMQLYSHQTEAIKRAAENRNYVLTTGTGSGKSLSYIIPIVNHVLKTGSGKGIKAIIVYPMNALANSQEKELEKYVGYGIPNSERAVTFHRYTGQESESQKIEIRKNPPDIILTNYVMLELILTRPDEAPLVASCKNLKYLVLDELHTYRGRQGADVAMLIRRTKEATKASDIICVGTSATMSSSNNLAVQKNEISRVSSLLFGSPVTPENVIGESLQRVTAEYDFENQNNLNKLKQDIAELQSITSLSFEQIKTHHLSSWIETTFGLNTKNPAGILTRSEPISISGPGGGAEALSKLTGLAPEACIEAIQQALLLGFKTINPVNGFPVFAFRLHQFISRGDTVYSSLDQQEFKHLTLQKQLYVPNSQKKKILLPLVFCRHCGQEYYTVRRSWDEEAKDFVNSPRELSDTFSDKLDAAGFLYDPVTNVDAYELPADWRDQNGEILHNRRADMPEIVFVGLDGRESKQGRRMLYMKAPFKFCPSCGVSFAASQHSDFAKLTALGTEGRSTATTILSLSAVRHLRQMDIAPQAKKLLSFTDNRQDASLQAGHFNDFVQVGILRGGLYQALVGAGDEGIRHSELTRKVFDSLQLDFSEYASNPDIIKGTARLETDRALRNVLGYYLYNDLRRGWRVTAPNLEQTGLLEIDYLALGELASDEEEWNSCHPALATASHKKRYQILRVLLDLMRRSLAIKVSFLNPPDQESILQQSIQRLIKPWGFDENLHLSSLNYASFLYPRSRIPGKDFGQNVYLSTRSGFAQYLKRSGLFPEYARAICVDETRAIIETLLTNLAKYGLIEKVKEDGERGPAYQLLADAIIWKKGQGVNGFYDPIRQPSESMEGRPVNQFFKDFYQLVAGTTLGLVSHEHTAQVNYEERERREEDFRSGRLPILYCSPTMELGIDIAQLNVVNMRNIPPTPANYAQRSGRAGRSGQPALVFSYCSSGSPHDQYFFKRPGNMVSGVVATPQIDIANEDMLRSHLNAIWLSESGLTLGNSLVNVIDTSGEPPKLELQASILASLNNKNIRARAMRRAEAVLSTISEYLQDSVWYTPDWLSDIFNQIPTQFERACDRWRDLYNAALRQQEIQNRIKLDPSRSSADKAQAKQLRQVAESQLEILLSSKGAAQSDFYSYRYFASEGFLPGYNFPRLPLSAFIPGRNLKNSRDEYLSRPRFLAITEFGPRSFIYHEGSRYVINQVIMPAQDEHNSVVTSEIKLCPECGYLHLESHLDTCENCECKTLNTIPRLFRLQNVVAKRRDQINCDEEERLKLGFDVRTTLRFASKGGQRACLKTELRRGDELLARLTYGDAATLWRINMGYRKRKSGDTGGFLLDAERGYWAKNSEQDPTGDEDSPLSRNTIMVRPYVSDTRNCLLFEPQFETGDTVMASLQAALKIAIQRVFELEDSELAAEMLPSRDNRKSILFYEATEGGAGVLKQVTEADNYRKVIRTAIELCHYDSTNFTDLKHSEFSREDCEAACYDCLLSYSNQMDHPLLDRKAILDPLITLLAADFSRSSSHLSRQDQYEQLKRLAGSDLEIKWLDFIYNNSYNLPTSAQQLIEECRTRSDYMYEPYVVIFIDGPVHDQPNQKAKDREIMQQFIDIGRHHVIRFRYDDNWQAIVDANANIFGSKGKQ